MLKPLPPRPARGTRLARGAAIFAIVVAAEVVIARRLDLIATATLYASLVAAAIVALIAAVAVLVAMRDVWREGAPGFGAAMAALVFTVLALMPVAAAAVAAAFYPPIFDVATDPDRPLDFRLRPDPPPLPVPLATAPQAFPVLQEAAYPDIAPRVVPLSTVEAHAAAHLAVQELGWTITFEMEPADENETGLLEASARSPLLGTPGDVVVRITPAEGGTRLDVRSASRFAIHDLGENARRVRAFFSRFDEIKDRSVAG